MRVRAQRTPEIDHGHAGPPHPTGPVSVGLGNHGRLALLRALRREGGIWATDDIERFIVSHSPLDQSTVGAPRGR